MIYIQAIYVTMVETNQSRNVDNDGWWRGQTIKVWVVNDGNRDNTGALDT